MVFFTCNACGQSVKKAQVEKHYMTQCRNCEVLSCMDCGKDFAGDAYKNHTSCVTENEKYGGKDYKAPAKANKGEAKQQQWLQRLQEAKESSKYSPAVADLLNKVAEYPNVPRKKSKFENFLYNSLRVKNRSLVEQVWDVFNAAGTAHFKAMAEEAAKQNSKAESKPDSEDNSATDQSQDSNNNGDQSGAVNHEPSEGTDQSQISKKKKKKKKDKNADIEADTVESSHKDSKKDLKRRKRQGDPDVDIPEEGDDELVNTEKVKKTKKKKKQLQDTDEQLHISQQEEVNGKSKKKKGKRNGEANGLSSGKRKRGSEEENADTTEEFSSQKVAKLDDSTAAANGDEAISTKKFKWEKVILAILQTYPDQQLSLKKLRKKVLNEYHSCGGDVRIKTDEQLRGTFEKKVNKNPNIKVHKEIVTLIT